MELLFKQIPPSYTIGDSLSTINNNYYTLDVWTSDIVLSAANMWEPLLDYYESIKDDWQNTITIVRDNSANWISTNTTVQNFSAKWISPITIFYPGIFPAPFTTDNLITITNFVKKTFPIYSGLGDYPGVYGTRRNLPPGTIVTRDFIDTDGDFIDDRYQRFPGDNGSDDVTFDVIPNFLEGQVVVVYNLTYLLNINYINVNSPLTDYTVCRTNSRRVCITCTNRYTGGGPCNSGYFNCGGRSNSCSQCQDVVCSYNSPPFYDMENNNNVGKSQIKANVVMKYNEQREEIDIKAAIFKVVNCQWVFQRFLTA